MPEDQKTLFREGIAQAAKEEGLSMQDSAYKLLFEVLTARVARLEKREADLSRRIVNLEMKP